MAEFKLEKVMITADRELGQIADKYPLDIKAYVGEISFFESLFKTYLTAQIAVIDDAGIFNETVQLQGTEYVEFEIHRENNPMIELKMRIVSIVKQQKLNDKTTAFVINLISPHAYNDANVKVSKSYYDQLEDITETILNDYLDVDVIRDDTDYFSDTPSVQGPVKLITPYISPLETAEWLMERATGALGSPYFVWTTVFDQENEKDKVRFGDWAQIVREQLPKAQADANIYIAGGEGVWETKRSFGQSGGVADQGKITDKSNRANIISYSSPNVENTLQMINSGAVGAQVSNLDPYANQQMSRHHGLDKFLIDMGGTFGTTYDGENKVTVENVSQEPAKFNARYVNTLTSYGTYGYAVGYHDVVDQSMLLNKMRKGTLMSAMHRNAMDVVLSGYNFLDADEGLKAGDIVFVAWQSASIKDDAPKQSKLDERRTGYYIIMDLRRDFLLDRGTTEAVATISKVMDFE
jgi:hypothetical protein